MDPEPEAAELLVRLDEVAERPHCVDATVSHYNDLIGAPQRRLAVRYNKARGLRVVSKEALPQPLLGVDIERAGQSSNTRRSGLCISILAAAVRCT